MSTGRTVWITGLSGAGKSTLAAAVAACLRSRGNTVVVLDGDELRTVFETASLLDGDAHERDNRLRLALQYARLCRLLASQGLTVVIATISMFREVHAWNRAHLPGYFEAYLKVPLEELRRRDPKAIYRRYDAGQLRNVAGIDLPVDEPEAPDWMAEHDPARSVEDLAFELVNILEMEGRR
ncbi:MAG: adenylyl-sulfate kinase [Rhodocyclaceae bacterium]|jgi:adenylylsulfate kinase|nr:adenylyl-sulfate kinase [Rhodocyclaceae bacterium]MCL4757170.1 adenylyl-sulfate kinase [Rhodocyclaceae bacterium]